MNERSRSRVSLRAYNAQPRAARPRERARNSTLVRTWEIRQVTYLVRIAGGRRALDDASFRGELDGARDHSDDLLRGLAVPENGVRLRQRWGETDSAKARLAAIIYHPRRRGSPPRGRNSRSPLFYKNFMGQDIRYERDRGAYPTLSCSVPCSTLLCFALPSRRDLREIRRALR